MFEYYRRKPTRDESYPQAAAAGTAMARREIVLSAGL